MKKINLLFVSIALMSFILTSCGGNASKKIEEAKNAAEEAIEEAAQEAQEGTEEIAEADTAAAEEADTTEAEE